MTRLYGEYEMNEFFNFNFDKAAHDLRLVFLRTPKCLDDDTKLVIRRIFGYDGDKTSPGYGKLNWDMRGAVDKDKIRNAWNLMNR